MDERYRLALTDWLACAYAGHEQKASIAARATGGDLYGRVASAATSGHVLDFDDTYLPGLAHLSAPVGPAACVLGAEIGATVGDVLEAYARGFEAMGAVTRASHPQLYDRGWHPTAVCGGLGAAVAAAHLLDLDRSRTEQAVSFALLSAGGLLSAFGSDGKSLQVAFAAAHGVRAARAALEGARSTTRVLKGFADTYGATWAEPDAAHPAIDENWIKAYPCCLQTHGAIEAADEARRAGEFEPPEVIVHPVSRQAAPYDDVSEGLEAKFSIPYTVAFTLLNGPPGIGDFDAVDVAVADLAARVRVTTSADLLESEARLVSPSGFEARVEAATGSPRRPMTPKQLRAKVATLAGDALDGMLDDFAQPAKVLADAARLS